MKVGALVSGGKDSVLSMLICNDSGHEIVCMGHIKPESESDDSWMYQSVASSVVVGCFQELFGLPLEVLENKGTAVNQSLYYVPTEGDEVEILCKLLTLMKEKYGIEAVTSGAVFSDYQRIRVETCCAIVGLKSIAPLWHLQQDEVLELVSSYGIDAVIAKTCSMGLDASHILKRVTDCVTLFESLNAKCGFHIAGEGGEYESLVLAVKGYAKCISLENPRATSEGSDQYMLKMDGCKVVLCDEPETKRNVPEFVSAVFNDPFAIFPKYDESCVAIESEYPFARSAENVAPAFTYKEFKSVKDALVETRKFPGLGAVVYTVDDIVSSHLLNSWQEVLDLWNSEEVLDGEEEFNIVLTGLRGGQADNKIGLYVVDEPLYHPSLVKSGSSLNSQMLYPYPLNTTLMSTVSPMTMKVYGTNPWKCCRDQQWLLPGETAMCMANMLSLLFEMNLSCDQIGCIIVTVKHMPSSFTVLETISKTLDTWSTIRPPVSKGGKRVRDTSIQHKDIPIVVIEELHSHILEGYNLTIQVKTGNKRCEPKLLYEGISKEELLGCHVYNDGSKEVPEGVMNSLVYRASVYDVNGRLQKHGCIYI